jgi:hypothetical protein
LDKITFKNDKWDGKALLHVDNELDAEHPIYSFAFENSAVVRRLAKNTFYHGRFWSVVSGH